MAPTCREPGAGEVAGHDRPSSPRGEVAEIVPLPLPASRRGTKLIAQVLERLRVEAAAEGLPPHPSSSSHLSDSIRRHPSWGVRLPDDAA